MKYRILIYNKKLCFIGLKDTLLSKKGVKEKFYYLYQIMTKFMTIDSI